MTPARSGLRLEAAPDLAKRPGSDLGSRAVRAARRPGPPMAPTRPVLRLEAASNLASARAAISAVGRSVQRTAPARR